MGRSARVLVVEDEPMFQDLTRAILSIDSHEIEIANDAFEALQLLGRSRFDCIVIDYHLPEIDGYAFARLVRDMARGRNEVLKLIAVTADRDGLALRRASDVMFDAILPKPVSAKVLLDVVRAATTPDENGELLRAARTLVRDPADGAAIEVSRAFWRAAGLSDRPRAVAWPTPTMDQASALALCFEPSSPDKAQVLVLLANAEPNGMLAELGHHVLLLPTISVNRIQSSLVDCEFSLLDRICWSRLAALLLEAGRRIRRVPSDVLLSDDPIDQVAVSLYVRSRDLTPGSDLRPFGVPLEGSDAERLRRLIGERLEQLCSVSPVHARFDEAGHCLQHMHRLDIAESMNDAPLPYAEVEVSRSAPDAASDRGSMECQGGAMTECATPGAHFEPLVSALDEAAIAARVLLIEPSELLGEIFAAVIKSISQSVTVSPSIDLAVAAMAESKFNLLVLPIEMWHESPSLQSTFQKSDNQIGIIFTFPEGYFITQPSSWGSIEYLCRPFKSGEIISCVKRVMHSYANSSIYSLTVFEELVSHIGIDIAVQLCRKLSNNMELSTGPVSAEYVHKLKASSGVLGFLRLSDACGRLEQILIERGETPMDLMVFNKIQKLTHQYIQSIIVDSAPK